MEIPTIAPEDISQFHKLFAEFKLLQEQASAAIEAAKTNKENEITIARDGQPVVVMEDDLWTEVYHLGPGCEAGTILSEKYPDPFRLSREAEGKKAEIKTFAISKWGIDPLGMTLSDIIRIIEGVIDYKLKQSRRGGREGRHSEGLCRGYEKAWVYLQTYWAGTRVNRGAA